MLHPQVHTAHNPPGRTDRLVLSTAYPDHGLLVWPDVTSPTLPHSLALRRGSGNKESSRISTAVQDFLGRQHFECDIPGRWQRNWAPEQGSHQGGGGGGQSSRPTLLRGPPPQAAWEASMPFGMVLLRNNTDGIYEYDSWDHC